MHRIILVIWGAIMAIVVGAGALPAQTLYVTDSFEINLRTGPGNEYRILALLPSGTRVEALEENEEWARVRTEKGSEGWLLRRYVSPEVPARTLVERLQRENERLKTAAEKATEQARGLASENKELSGSVHGGQKELDELQKKYASLRADAENVLQLKERFERATSELERMTSEKERLADENRNLRAETRMRWFLAGAGVMGGSLLFGFIMGRIQRRGRRTSLYS